MIAKLVKSLLASLMVMFGAAAQAQTYGILWQNVKTGRFGVWQVGDHGTVRGAYDLTTHDPTYFRWPVPDTTNTYYYICGVSPDDPNGCAKTSTYSVTQLFPQRVSGFDFLYYNQLIGGMSPQLSDFTGTVQSPGHALVNLDRTPAVCDAASGCSTTWTLVGAGVFDRDGAPSLLWYNAGANQFGVWQISNFDIQTVIGYNSWTACGGGCAAYGTPVGAADFDGDGISDILWLRSDGSLTVFLEDGSGGNRTLALSRNVPVGFSLVGVRREGEIEVRMVWYNPFSGALQNWNLDTQTNEISASTVTWNCDGCYPDWRTVGLVRIE